MLYAVTVEPLNAIFFMHDQPDGSPWDVEEGVELDIYPFFGTGAPDRGPLRQTLCVSIADPKCYRVFSHSRDIDREAYRPAGRHFGGLFSRTTWERFAKTTPALIAAICGDDDEPLGDAQEAFAVIERGA